MNIYFYSASRERCTTNCSYKTCPKRHLYALQHAPPSEIKLLPNKSLLQPTVDNPLRNGDLIILHVERRDDLKQLIANKNMFEQCRLILILSKELFESSKDYHSLNPRFIATAEQNPIDLRTVVYKLIDRLTSWNQNSQATDVSLPQPSAR